MYIDEKEGFSVVILSAGSSIRMGVPKFQLKVKDGSSFLATIIKKYLFLGCSEIVVVANPANIETITTISKQLSGTIKIALNPENDSNKMQSVIFGLQLLSLHFPVFIQPVDSPFFQVETLQTLILKLKGSDYAVPVADSQGGHPVVVSADVAKLLSDKEKCDETLRSFLKKFDGRRVKVKDKMILTNINTPEEYRRVLFQSQ